MEYVCRSQYGNKYSLYISYSVYRRKRKKGSYHGCQKGDEKSIVVGDCDYNSDKRSITDP